MISKFLECIARDSPLVVFGDGKQTRDFIFVKDIAQANRAALDGEGGGVCNVGTGQSRTLLQVIEALSLCVGRSLAVQHMPPRDGDIHHSAARVDHVRELLGFTAQTSLQDGLNELIQESRLGPG